MAEQSYTDAVAIDSSAGSETVNLSGTATTPPHLEISPASIDFGTAALGATASRSFSTRTCCGACPRRWSSITSRG